MKQLLMMWLVGLAGCGDAPDASVNPTDIANSGTGAAILSTFTDDLEDAFNNVSGDSTICDQAATVGDTECADDPRISDPFPRGYECTAERQETAQCMVDASGMGCDAVLDCSLGGVL